MIYGGARGGGGLRMGNYSYDSFVRESIEFAYKTGIFKAKDDEGLVMKRYRRDRIWQAAVCDYVDRNERRMRRAEQYGY